jgi:hypothetical protein
MSKLFDQLANELFQVLKGYGKTLSLFDENGKRVYEPSDARRMFAEPDKMMISIDEDGSNSEVRIFLSQNSKVDRLEKPLNTLRHLTTRFNVLFSVRKYSRQLSAKDFAYQSLPVTENSILESLYGFQKTSYQKINSSRLVVRHSARVNEEKRGARTRNINALFVENNKGERFKFPFIHLSGARAWAQHLNHGGSPFDKIGQQIVELASESLKLMQISRHVLKNQKSLTEEAFDLRNKVKARIFEIRKTLGKLSRVCGYVREVKNWDFSNVVLEDQDLSIEHKKLGVLLGIAEDNPLSESLMPVVLLIKGENMNNNNTKFHRVIALENAEDLVETLIYEYGYKEGSSWKKNGNSIVFFTPESYKDAKSYLALTETDHLVEDGEVDPSDKVLSYAMRWVEKSGSDDWNRVGDDWSPKDKKAMDGKARELAQGIKQLLNGSLQVHPVPPPATRAANPGTALALQIGRLLDPKAAMQNDMLHNYLSALYEKLGGGEQLTPVEKQIATKAGALASSSSSDSDVAENVWREETQYSEQNIDVLKELAEIDEWFASFNPDNLLSEEPDVHIHVHDDNSENESAVSEDGLEEAPGDGLPAGYDAWKTYAGPNYDDHSDTEKAVETAVSAFDLSGFFKHAGNDFDWNSREFNREEPEDMVYDPKYIKRSIVGYLQFLANNHTDKADYLQDSDFEGYADEFFEKEVKPEMEKEGYTFEGQSKTENIEDDMMSGNTPIPGDVQHSFGQEIRSANIKSPGDSDSEQLARLRHLAGI